MSIFRRKPKKKTSFDRYNTPAGKVFDVFNIIFLSLFGLVTLLPFLYVVAASFSSNAEIVSRSFFIVPHGFTLENIKFILSSDAFIRSFFLTILVTIVGTTLQMVLSLLFAYPLSNKNLVGRKMIIRLVIFSMLFSGGMIPTYLVIKSLGMLDSLWALIIPAAINPFNLIIIKNHMENLPEELKESARIDGANEMTMFTKIILPLSMPVVATFSLFSAVGIWNDFFSGFLYINDSSKWPIQVLLRQITMMGQIPTDGTILNDNVTPPGEGVQFAAILASTFAILCVYPFVQKHFAKGMMVGSLK